jgi:hypothetical protein
VNALTPTPAVSTPPPASSKASKAAGFGVAAPTAAVIIQGDPRLLLPAKLDGFVLIYTEPNPTPIAGKPAPAETGRWARYVESGEKPKLVLSLLADRTKDLVEVEPGCAKTQIASHEAVGCIDSELSETCVAWRNGDWRLMLCAFPVEGEGSRKGAAPDRALVETHARAVSTWSDAAIAGLEPTQREARVTALDAAAKALEAAAGATRVSLARLAGKIPPWVLSYEANGGGSLRAHVGPAWFALDAATRQTEAVAFWKAWATANTPSNLDASRITLVDNSGRRVGGSGVMGGSSVSVE